MSSKFHWRIDYTAKTNYVQSEALYDLNKTPEENGFKSAASGGANQPFGETHDSLIAIHVWARGGERMIEVIGNEGIELARIFTIAGPQLVDMLARWAPLLSRQPF